MQAKEPFCGRMGDKGFSVLRPMLCIAIAVELHLVSGDLSYSIPEEMKRESVIGNIAKDLGLDLRTLTTRKIRVDVEGTRKQHCDIDLNTGCCRNRPARMSGSWCVCCCRR